MDDQIPPATEVHPTTQDPDEEQQQQQAAPRRKRRKKTTEDGGGYDAALRALTRRVHRMAEAATHGVSYEKADITPARAVHRTLLHELRAQDRSIAPPPFNSTGQISPWRTPDPLTAAIAHHSGHPHPASAPRHAAPASSSAGAGKLPPISPSPSSSPPEPHDTTKDADEKPTKSVKSPRGGVTAAVDPNVAEHRRVFLETMHDKVRRVREDEKHARHHRAAVVRASLQATKPEADHRQGLFCEERLEFNTLVKEFERVRRKIYYGELGASQQVPMADDPVSQLTPSKSPATETRTKDGRESPFAGTRSRPVTDLVLSTQAKSDVFVEAPVLGTDHCTEAAQLLQRPTLRSGIVQRMRRAHYAHPHPKGASPIEELPQRLTYEARLSMVREGQRRYQIEENEADERRCMIQRFHFKSQIYLELGRVRVDDTPIGRRNRRQIHQRRKRTLSSASSPRGGSPLRKTRTDDTLDEGTRRSVEPEEPGGSPLKESGKQQAQN